MDAEWPQHHRAKHDKCIVDKQVEAHNNLPACFQSKKDSFVQVRDISSIVLDDQKTYTDKPSADLDKVKIV